MVVDCGGGTVDITVHQLSGQHATLRELHKASGGACGSLGTSSHPFSLVCVRHGGARRDAVPGPFSLSTPAPFAAPQAWTESSSAC